MRFVLLLIALAAASPAFSADSLRLAGGPNGENALRRFVENNPRLKAIFNDVSRREEYFLAQNRDTDLHDAVTDENGRRELEIESLPGMKTPEAPVCRTLRECPTPDLALDVPDSEGLPGSVRRLIRPWMLLQRARGSEIILTPTQGSGDAVLTVKLKDSEASPLVLNVTPRLLGGFKVWFDQPLVLASLYGRERDAVLKTR